MAWPRAASPTPSHPEALRSVCAVLPRAQADGQETLDAHVPSTWSGPDVSCSGPTLCVRS